MKQWGYVLLVLSVIGWLGASAVHTLAAKEAGETKATISAADAVKIAEKEGRILSLHRHEYPKKTGHYYRITVVESSENEVKDLYIDAKTGKVVQRIEHPAEMPPGR
jgi:uncharacterized membrane protein YkoI